MSDNPESPQPVPQWKWDMKLVPGDDKPLELSPAMKDALEAKKNLEKLDAGQRVPIRTIKTTPGKPGIGE